LPPLTQPSKVLGVGLNYPEHAAENALEAPTEPVFFAKLASAIVGPNDDICLPRAAPRRVDYEAELAVVIGRAGRDIAVEDAMGFVLEVAISEIGTLRNRVPEQDAVR
jgi:acylpyruvate hydrolase